MSRRGAREGSIYRRADGYWVGAVSLGGAKRKVVYGKTRGEVAEKMKALLASQQKGVTLRPSDRLTVGTYLTKWVDGVPATVRPSTFAGYRSVLRTHLLPRLGRVALSKLSPADLSGAYSAMLAEGRAPRTVRHAHVVLSRALREAEIAGLVSRNVARLTRPPRVSATEMRTLTSEQARTLLRTAEGDRLHALYAVALASGARQGELFGLRWTDVDLERGTIRIARTLSRGVSEWAFTEPKTATSRRTVSVGTAATDALRAHKRRQAAERLRMGEAWQDMGLVFTTEIGTPLSPQNVMRRSFYPLLLRAGVPRVRFHDLRHSAATLLLEAGAHPRVVAERLGHSDPGLTLRVYAHATATMQREATAAMDRVLGA